MSLLSFLSYFHESVHEPTSRVLIVIRSAVRGRIPLFASDMCLAVIVFDSSHFLRIHFNLLSAENVVQDEGCSVLNCERESQLIAQSLLNVHEQCYSLIKS